METDTSSKVSQTKASRGAVDVDESSDDDMIGPMPTQGEDLEEDNSEDEDEFPISHELILNDHTKVSPPLPSH